MAATPPGARRLPASVEIVRFRPRHLARILQIERAAFAKESYTRKIFRDLYSECGGLFLVAKVSRRIAGYMATCADAGQAEIVSVAVAPELRRQGIAAALIEYTLGRLSESGARSIELMVRVDNRPAIRFYRRFGFRRVEEVPGYYEDGLTALRMRRRL